METDYRIKLKMETDHRIKELLDEQKDLQAKLLERSKEVFKEVSQQLFDQYPELESFSWTQYTPWFNDGEECVFGVHADADYGIEINDTSVDDYDNEDDRWVEDEELGGYFEIATGKRLGNGYTSTKGLDYNEWEHRYVYRHNRWPGLTGIQNVVSEFINSFDEQTLKIMFGDHIQVTVYRDRVEVDEHSHD